MQLLRLPMVLSFLPSICCRSSVTGLTCQPCVRTIRMGEARATDGEVAELQKPGRKRIVVEHITLFQMKEDLTEEQERDMLDHLYTLQYRMRGIIATSLGRIHSNGADGCTHAFVVRFPTKEALDVYYGSAARWRVINEYIIPFYHGMLCVDFEAEVEDDIGPIFRRGEDFEEGVEHLLLFQVKDGMKAETVEMAFDALSQLLEGLGTLVVQYTLGKNVSILSKGYTHAMVIRFPSEEARDVLVQHPFYVQIMGTNFVAITNKILSLSFSVSPVGTTSL